MLYFFVSFICSFSILFMSFWLNILGERCMVASLEIYSVPSVLFNCISVQIIPTMQNIAVVPNTWMNVIIALLFFVPFGAHRLVVARGLCDRGFFVILGLERWAPVCNLVRSFEIFRLQSYSFLTKLPRKVAKKITVMVYVNISPSLRSSCRLCT